MMEWKDVSGTERLQKSTKAYILIPGIAGLLILGISYRVFVEAVTNGGKNIGLSLIILFLVVSIILFPYMSLRYRMKNMGPLLAYAEHSFQFLKEGKTLREVNIDNIDRIFYAPLLQQVFISADSAKSQTLLSMFKEYDKKTEISMVHASDNRMFGNTAKNARSQYLGFDFYYQAKEYCHAARINDIQGLLELLDSLPLKKQELPKSGGIASGLLIYSK